MKHYNDSVLLWSTDAVLVCVLMLEEHARRDALCGFGGKATPFDVTSIQVDFETPVANARDHASRSRD